MEVLFLLLILFHSISGHETYNCTTLKDNFIMACSSANISSLLDYIPVTITHLLISLKENTETSIHQPKQFLNFSHFQDLEVLLLEPEGFRTPKVVMNSSSLSSNKRLRVIESRLWLVDFEDTLLSSNAMLNELTLSFTEKNLYNISTFLEKSVASKQHLRKISFRHFNIMDQQCLQETIELCDVLQPLKNLPIEELDLAQNDISVINGCFAQLFPSLRKLDISQNRLTTPNPWTSDGDVLYKWIPMLLIMPNLTDLYYNNQGYVYYEFEKYNQPEYLEKYINSSYTSTIRKHLLSFVSELPSSHSSNISDDEEWKHGISTGSLETLLLDHIKIGAGGFIFNKNGTTEFCLSSKLRYINISHNAQWNMTVFVNWKVEGLNNFEHLNLQYNGLKGFGEGFVTNAPFLKTLLLGGNILGQSLSSSNEPLGNFLKEHHKLQVLDLADNSIDKLPRSLLVNNADLRVVDLSYNSIKNFSLDISSLLFLQILNLSNNQITYLDEETIHQLENISNTGSPGNLTIDLTNNQLSCACFHLRFVKWIQTTIVIFSGKENYLCAHPYYGVAPIMDVNIDDLQSQCFPSLAKTIIISVTVSTTVTFLLTSSIIIYCKRWRLRFWWYVIRQGWKRLNETSNLLQYRYDVFVAYNRHDRHWVYGPLIQELETKAGFKLCIDQRDFPAADWLNEVIVEKISESRKTLLVLSPHFLESTWCQFEMKWACGRHYEEGRDIVVPVILEPLPFGAVSGTLYTLLKNKLYLEWTSDPDGQELFWRKLKDALGHNNYKTFA